MESVTNEAIASLSPTRNPLDDKGLLRFGKMLIDGEWADAASGKTFDDIYPGNESVIAHVAAGDAEDVDRAVRAARRAQGPL